MELTREVFTPLDKRDDLEKVFVFIDKIDNKYKIELKSDSIQQIIEVQTYRQVWGSIQILYRTFIKNNKIMIIYEKNTSTKLSYGLGLNTILKKIEETEILERSLKRMKNIKKRMVVDTPYKSSKKKIDMRIFDRKRYASSNNRGI
tara:strand:+ start:659 stop:1096 length:438 start_codon:yes stop_codon:yes gene_type:complete